MKKLIVIAAILLAAVLGVAAYLTLTTPKSARGVRFPLSDSQRALIAAVPASAETFALIPSAAALDPKLRANPLTADVLEQWERSHSLPSPWMVGGADLVTWRDGDATRYAIRLDPVRTLLVRAYLLLGGELGEMLVINPPPAATPAADLPQLFALSQSLPPGDAFVVQRAGSRGGFPPIGRPAVTSVSVTPDAIDVTSRAPRSPADPPPVQSPAAPRFARGAMLAATFASMPRAVEDLNRIFGTKVSPLLENGGTITVYDIDPRKLLPRPSGVIAVPDDPARRAAFDEFVGRVRQGESLGIRIRTAEAGGMLLLSFDDSIDIYLKDAQEPLPWLAGLWAIRADPKRLVPVLSKLEDSIGLRVASPHLYRSARDLGRWIGALQQATSLEAAASEDASAVELKVRVAAK